MDLSKTQSYIEYYRPYFVANIFLNLRNYYKIKWKCPHCGFQWQWFQKDIGPPLHPCPNCKKDPTLTIAPR